MLYLLSYEASLEACHRRIQFYTRYMKRMTWCVFLKQLFAEGEVNIGEYLPRRRLGKYSPIFTSPSANNCFSVITQVNIRENLRIDCQTFLFTCFWKSCVNEQRRAQITWFYKSILLIRNDKHVHVQTSCVLRRIKQAKICLTRS